jgi:integrase
MVADPSVKGRSEFVGPIAWSITAALLRQSHLVRNLYRSEWQPLLWFSSITNPKKIQTLLGHASINMTMDVYGHLFENAEEDVSMFEKLESDLIVA